MSGMTIRGKWGAFVDDELDLVEELQRDGDYEPDPSTHQPAPRRDRFNQ